MSDGPALKVLNLGAGVQSTTLAIMGARGEVPGGPPDVAIFADTGWEPAQVYAHLERLDQEVLAPSGITLHRVSNGNIRTDPFQPDSRFVTIPLYTVEPCRECGASGRLEDGTRCKRCRGTGRSEGMGRRQCTNEYKLKPIKARVRALLGYPHPTPVPKSVWAESWIGISTDEVGRARDNDVRYSRARHPLLELGISRKDCERYLAGLGWGGVSKSACIGCPFHGNRQWRDLRDNHPEEWADAVAYDREVRNGAKAALAKGHDLRGQQYLHRSRVPLDEAPIDHVTTPEWNARQVDLLDLEALEEGPEDGCSPFSCRSDGN